MLRSIDLRSDEFVTLIGNHQLFGKAGISMASVGLCLIMLVGCVSQEPAKSAPQRSVNIDSFSVVKTSPDSVDIELVSSNDGSMGPLCLGALSKSKDGSVRTEDVFFQNVPVGQNLHISARVLRPHGAGNQQTDFLVAEVYLCGKDLLLTREFDWAYSWPKISAVTTTEEITDFGTRHSWLAFLQNFQEEDFPALDSLMDKWNNPKERDKDGLWKIDGFRGAMNSLTQSNKLQETYKLIQKWRKLNQKSQGAAIAEAKYWAAYAWHIRGNVGNLEVDPVAMKVFHERMKRAEQVLDDSKAFASNNPLWYETYLDISVDEKRDDKFIAHLFDEGIRKHPYFQPLYIDMAERWSHWSGENSDWQKVDEVVDRAVALTAEKDGTINYALLYAQISDQQKVEFDLFRNSLVSWPKMRESFEELVKRYPSEDNLNEFAAFACRAGDKEAYLGIRPKILEHIVPGKWPSNYSIDLCDHRFMQYS